MLRDPEYQQEEKIIVRDAGIFQLEQIIQRYDSDGDGKLNSQELDALYKRVQYYEKAGAQNSAKTFLLTPLLSQGLLPAKVMLERFDQNKDGKLDAAEFQLIFDRHGASR